MGELQYHYLLVEIRRKQLSILKLFINLFLNCKNYKKTIGNKSIKLDLIIIGSDDIITNTQIIINLGQVVTRSE